MLMSSLWLIYHLRSITKLSFIVSHPKVKIIILLSHHIWIIAEQSTQTSLWKKKICRSFSVLLPDFWQNHPNSHTWCHHWCKYKNPQFISEWTIRLSIWLRKLFAADTRFCERSFAWICPLQAPRVIFLGPAHCAQVILKNKERD